MKIARNIALAALACAAPAAAQPAPPATPPKLIVAIAVDQLSSDLFQQYRQHFDGGFKRLSQGVVFPAGYQGHNATETCPGHSTILTGSRPSRTGIIANNWFDLGVAREDKQIYCSEDPRIPGSSSDKYTVSSHHLRVPALGDLMKRADPRARVAVVAGKDRAAIMMGGYAPDQRWWWGGKGFTSHGGPAPLAVGIANQAVEGEIARARGPRDLPKVCEAQSRAIALSGGATATVGDGRFARDAGDARGFRYSPDFDRAVAGLATGLRREMRLGEGEAADLLIVGLSATDYVGHAYGNQGAEMCGQLLALDEILDEMFDKLDESGVDYLVMLTADHGGHDIPERNRDHGMPDAARVDAGLNATEMGKTLGRRLNIAGPLLYGDGSFGDMYVDRKLSAAQRARVLREALRSYRAHPQVAAVFTRDELRAAAPPRGAPDNWTLIERAKASFDAERSGDFVVLLKPRITPIARTGPGYAATHGSPWDYDRKVPILFWRKGLHGFEQSNAVETADILPTLAALIRLPIAPGTIDGRCLDLDEGLASSCSPAR